jgi:hypothetical protein
MYRPLGRFIVSLPQCQAASLIEGDLEFNKNTTIRALVNKKIKLLNYSCFILIAN